MNSVIALLRTLWVAITRPGLLGRLSRGRGGRAVLVLIGIFLIPVAACWLIWVLGLIPIFEYARWIPIGLVSVVGVVSILGLFLVFGFWGTGANSGQDGGDQFEYDFRPAVAFGLGWVRWFMQLVLVGGVLYAWMAVFTDVQLWNVFSTKEIDALPARAATMPVPADWKATWTDTGDDGANPYPNGYYERTYDVPAGYTFARMRAWMSGPRWAAGSGGAAFGALKEPHCDSTTADCRAVKSAPGDWPRYTVYAWFTPALHAGGLPEVRLRLEYTEYDRAEDPMADLSSDTRDRAALIPIPPNWSRSGAHAGTSDTGEIFYQAFDVPASFSGKDLTAWFAGPTWTHPATGPAFGAIKQDRPCQKLTDHYLCSLSVTAHDNIEDGPVESLLVSYKPVDHTVTVNFERNGG